MISGSCSPSPGLMKNDTVGPLNRRPYSANAWSFRASSSTRLKRALSSADQKSGYLLFTAVLAKYQAPADNNLSFLILIYKVLPAVLLYFEGEKS
jgi:hypothetical protein